MDDVTTKMCIKGEGRIGFARVLIELNAEKVIKDRIEVFYKGNVVNERITKTIEVEYAWKPVNCVKCKVFGHNENSCKLRVKDKDKEVIEETHANTDQGFKVVQNRKLRTEGQNNINRRNGNNGMYEFQRNAGRFVKTHDNRTNIRRTEYRKIEEGKGRMNDTEVVNKNNYFAESSTNNTQGNNKETITSGSKEKAPATEKSNGVNVTNSIVKDGIGTESYNRYSILDSLEKEDDLVPSLSERKIIDEILDKKIDANEKEKAGWNEEMIKYYKDKKKMFDVAKELEGEEDVIEGAPDEENYILRNEVDGMARNVLV